MIHTVLIGELTEPGKIIMAKTKTWKIKSIILPDKIYELKSPLRVVNIKRRRRLYVCQISSPLSIWKGIYGIGKSRSEAFMDLCHLIDNWYKLSLTVTPDKAFSAAVRDAELFINQFSDVMFL